MDQQIDNLMLLPAQRSHGRDIVWIASIAIIYFLTAWASMLLLFKPEGIAAVWPASGLFLSALLLTRRDLRPWLAGALFISIFFAERLAGTPLLISVIYAMAFTVEALLSCWLLHRFVGDPFSFKRVRDVTAWLALSVLFSNILMSVPAGVAGLLSGGGSFLKGWFCSAASDGVGNLLVTPFVLGWGAWLANRTKGCKWERTFEGAALFLTSCLLFFILFRDLSKHTFFALLLPYTTYPFLLWAALRFGVHGVATVSLLLAAISVPFAASGRITAFSFAPGVLDEVIVVQLFLAVMAGSSLFLAVLVAERKQAEESMMESGRSFRRLAESLPQLVWTCRGDGPCDYLSPQWVTYTGIPEAEQLGFRWLDQLHPDDRDRTVAAWNETIATDKAFDVEFRIRRNDGIYRWFKTRAVAVRDEQGRIVKWFGTNTDVEPMKQVESALRETNAYLENLFNYANAPIIVWNTQFQITRFNHAFELLTGRSACEVIGKSLEILFPPDLMEDSMALIKKTTGGERWESVEILIQHRDGSVRTLLWNSATVFSADGKSPMATIAQGHNITERKRAFEELRKHRDHLEQLVAERTIEVRAANDYNRGLIEASIDPFVTISKEGQITDVNHAMESITGRSRGELIGSDFADYFTDPERARSGCEQAFRDASVHDVELEVRHANGKTVPVLFNATVYGDSNGHEAGIFAVARDITKIRQAEAATQKRGEELQMILDSSPAMIFYKDTQNRFMRVNNALAAACGMPRAEMEGKSLSELFPEPEAQKYGKDDQSVMASGRPRLGIVEPMRTHNGTLWVQTDKVPYFDAQGKTIGIIGFSLDITARKQAEERGAKLNQDLMLRTEELEAANKELEAFSYSVSHDLRAPLRHVQGYVDMLRREAEGRLSQKGLHYMNTISDASREMGVLIDDLLSFSRMGRAEMCEVAVSLDKLVQETLRDLEPATRGRNIVWNIPTLPAVRADSAMLKLALVNLLDNAVKFTRPRDPAVIDIGVEGTDEGRLVLFVRDNGVGFDPQYSHKLFGIFQRLHRADEFEGTGIGLANVRRIIARHGGRTWAEGAVDKGATFYFTLKPSLSETPFNGKEQTS